VFSWIVEGLALALALVGFLAAAALDSIDVPHHLWGAPRKNSKNSSREPTAIRTIAMGHPAQTMPQDQPD